MGLGSCRCASACNSDTTTRASGSASPRRRSAAASTPSGRPRRTARTPSRRSRGSADARRRSSSAPRSCRCPRGRPRRRPRRSRRSTSSPAAASSSASGTSGPQVAEGWHGQAWGKPLTRTREYVEIVRTILRREEPLEHHGEHYDIPYSGAERDRPGQAAQADRAPDARGRADLPRRDRPEERRAGGGDRGRMAPDLLLAGAIRRDAPPDARGGLRAARRPSGGLGPRRARAGRGRRTTCRRRATS